MLIKIVFSASVMFGLLWFLARLAPTLGLLDYPDHRKRHMSPIPVVGGIALFVSLILMLLVFGAIPEKLGWVLIGASPLVLIGALDDRTNVGVRVRLLVQFLAALIPMIFGDLWLESTNLNRPFPEVFGPLGVLVTVFIILAVTNAFNMVDGADGLASGIALTSLVSLVAAQWLLVDTVLHPSWTLILFVCVFIFWLANLSILPIPKVFLGDSGSTSLGFILGWFVIYLSQNPYTFVNLWAIAWVLILPLGDMAAVISRRILDQRSPFYPDRLHIHHLLADQGWRSGELLGGMLGYSLVMAFIGIGIVKFWGSEEGLLILILAFVGQVIVHLRAIERLRVE